MVDYAIRAIEKPLTYKVHEIDLSSARTKSALSIAGDFLAVLDAPVNIDAKIFLDYQTNDELSLEKVTAIYVPFYQVYMTNSATGGTLKLLVGMGSTGFMAQTAASLTIDPRHLSMDPSERTFRRLFYRDDHATTTPRAIGVTASTAEVTHDAGTQGTVMPFNSHAKMLRVSDANATTNTVYYRFGRFADGKIGFEVRWWKDTDVDLMEIQFYDYDGTNYHRFGIRYDEGNNRWDYLSAAAPTWTAITGGGEVILNNSWNYLKVIFDTANNTYHRLQTNRLDVDLSALSEVTAADATEASAYVAWGITNLANDDDAYYSDFRIYLNDE